MSKGALSNRSRSRSPAAGCREKPFGQKTPADFCLLIEPQAGPSMFQDFSQNIHSFDVEIRRLIGIHEQKPSVDSNGCSRANVAVTLDISLPVRSHLGRAPVIAAITLKERLYLLFFGMRRKSVHNNTH